MILPEKYEDLSENSIVIGAMAIKLLKQKSFNVEDLFLEMRQLHSNLGLNKYLDILTFLRITEVISYENFFIELNNKGDAS